MRKCYLVICFLCTLGMGIVFASPSSDQLFTLSESILENANDTTNEHLQILQNIFTSCAENNKKEEINQLCTSFLEKSFPLLEAKRRTYREEELQIPLSGEIQTREIGPLSPEQVQKLVGISQALSGNTQSISHFGAMNGRRSQGVRDDTPKEDIRYYLVSLPEEHFSFLLASESQIDEVSIENLVSGLPEHRDFRDVHTYMQYLKDFPLRIEQTGGKVDMTSYVLAGGDTGFSGGIVLFLQEERAISITKYQLPEPTTFEQTVNNMRFFRTLPGDSQEREIPCTRTDELDTLTRYFTPEGNVAVERDLFLDLYTPSSNQGPLYTGNKEGLVSRTFPFGKNINTLLQQGDITILLGGSAVKDRVFLWNKNTPQVFYQIAPKSGPLFSSAFLGNFAIDIDNGDGTPSFS